MKKITQWLEKRKVSCDRHTMSHAELNGILRKPINTEVKTNKKTDLTPSPCSWYASCFSPYNCGTAPTTQESDWNWRYGEIDLVFFEWLSRQAPAICVAQPLLVFGPEKKRTYNELARVPARCSKQRIQPQNHYQFPAMHNQTPTRAPKTNESTTKVLHMAENSTIPFVDTKDPTVHMLNVTFVPTMSAQ